MTFRDIVSFLEENIKKLLEKKQYPIVRFEVMESPRSEFGDLTTNVSFVLAKTLKKKPQDISQRILEDLKGQVIYDGSVIQDLVAHQSGYLNFFINYPLVSKTTIQNSLNKDYGTISDGKDTRVVVEHTSVNPNKALHIGHVRNIVIGDCISRIFRKASFDVSVLNYVDNSGLQVADVIVGFKYGGFQLSPPDGQKFDHYCGDVVYVKTAQLYENDSNLLEKREQVLKELEGGSSDIYEMANSITKRVLSEQLKTCWRLGTSYDCLNYETHIIRSDLWSEAFEVMKKTGAVEFEEAGKNKGCWVIRSDNAQEEDKVLIRSNGTSTYIAKDIPYAAWKLGFLNDPFYYSQYDTQHDGRILWETSLEKDSNNKLDFSGDYVITVIDSRQSRLQNIIKKIMENLAADHKKKYIHLAYEAIVLSSSTASMLGISTSEKKVAMSGRKGVYVNADYVIDILGVRAYEETKKRNPQLEEQSLVKISESVAVGALRYAIIKQDLDKIITFDMEESLSLEGDTGPYIQYSHARASRILEKAPFDPDSSCSYEGLENQYEKQLVKEISKFEMKVKESTNNLSPKVIARYCYALASTFNAFYEHVTVIGAQGQEGIENQRLCLVLSFKETIAKALALIGIDAPEKM